METTTDTTDRKTSARMTELLMWAAHNADEVLGDDVSDHGTECLRTQLIALVGMLTEVRELEDRIASLERRLATSEADLAEVIRKRHAVRDGG